MVLSFCCMGMGQTLFGSGDEMDETMLTSFLLLSPLLSFLVVWNGKRRYGMVWIWSVRRRRTIDSMKLGTTIDASAVRF